MKIKGFLVILILALVLVYFLWMLKSGKDKKIPEQIEAFDRVKHKVTKTNMSTLEKAIDSFIAREGRTPECLRDIKVFYPLTTARLDAWGTSIKYERLSDFEFRLISAGRDKIFETEDDIILGN